MAHLSLSYLDPLDSQPISISNAMEVLVFPNGFHRLIACFPLLDPLFLWRWVRTIV